MALRPGTRELACPEFDDYMPPLTPDEAQRDLRYGQMAYVIHQGEQWPSGVLCRNCGGPWPCPLYRWGLAVLEMAGWNADDLRHLLERVKQGDVPWAT